MQVFFVESVCEDSDVIAQNIVVRFVKKGEALEQWNSETC